MMSSSTRQPPEDRLSPLRRILAGAAAGVSYRSARMRHLAGAGNHRVRGIDPRHRLPAPFGVLLVEELDRVARPEHRDIHRLEELMIVGAHEAFAAIEHGELHALE